MRIRGRMTKTMRTAWTALSKAYDYQSMDKRLSMKDFRNIWWLARLEERRYQEAKKRNRRSV